MPSDMDTWSLCQSTFHWSSKTIFMLYLTFSLCLRTNMCPLHSSYNMLQLTMTYSWAPCAKLWSYSQVFCFQGLVIWPTTAWLVLSELHTGLRARDHCTSSTLIGGKGGAGPSSLLHTMLEGPPEYRSECKMDVQSTRFLHGIEWIMFHGHLDYFWRPPLGGRPTTKPLGDHGTPNVHNIWFILNYHAWGPAWIEIHWYSLWLRAR